MQYLQWIELAFLLKSGWDCIFRLKLRQDDKTHPGQGQLSANAFVHVQHSLYISSNSI